jgi:hypothetical protein
MQPYFDPTRKTTSNKKYGRRPQKKMEDNQIFVVVEKQK